ncbi:MAG: efflux RND transporter periplasmic adaptor subunit [Thermoanaerobaculia bacterium]|nr:efflux RND transporter periplasmic adaptor subunit [Thermoanaerobaculia bacterium]MCZ7649919.1 efflux RND transporter periplasmic adaptor subunit [Thermoanaerobaculia bacterium]
MDLRKVIPSLAARAVLAGAGLFVLALSLGACGRPGADAAAPPPAEKIASVRTVELLPERVDEIANLPADLLPARRAVLAAEVPGVVETLRFESGQTVARGQLLLAIDTRALEQAVAEAQALARQAEAQYVRAENLFARRSITKQQMLDATTNRDVARARLASAELQRDKSRVRAPWSGRIAARRVEVGDYVVPGQPVAELVDIARLKVRAPARAADAPFLAAGAPVTIRVDAFPGETFEGRVARLDAELDPQSRTLALEVEIANPDERLRPGLPARLELRKRTLEGAFAVPLAALVDFEEGKAVYVVREGRAERRPVRLGPLVGDRIVVEDGLLPGERLVVEGQGQVSEGQRVAEAGAGA